MEVKHVAEAVLLHGWPAAGSESAVHHGDGDQDAVYRPRVNAFGFLFLRGRMARRR
jgi:hypothetical protein